MGRKSFVLAGWECMLALFMNPIFGPASSHPITDYTRCGDSDQRFSCRRSLPIPSDAIGRFAAERKAGAHGRSIAPVFVPVLYEEARNTLLTLTLRGAGQSNVMLNLDGPTSNPVTIHIQ